MHFNIERSKPTRFQIARLAHRIPLRAVDPRAGNLRNGSIRRYIRERRKPVGQRRRGRGPQQSMRGPPRIATSASCSGAER